VRWRAFTSGVFFVLALWNYVTLRQPYVVGSLGDWCLVCCEMIIALLLFPWRKS
jgi:hypothetical protein